MDDDLEGAAAALARRQGGVVARWQLRAAGAGDTRITRFARRRELEDPTAAVWTLDVGRASGDAVVWAAVLSATGLLERRQVGDLPDLAEIAEAAATSVGATAFSAAGVRGLVSRRPSRTQLLIPHRLVKRIPGVQAIRSRVPLGAVELVDGTPCVDAIRMLYDCCRLIEHHPDAVTRGRDLMSRADGLRHVQAAHLHLAVRVPHLYGLPGQHLSRAFAVAAMSLAKGHSHSGSEHRGRVIVTEIAEAYGLEVVPRPFEVLDDDGRRIAEADIAIPRIRYDCEIDGPHHDEPAQRRKDRIRDGRMRRRVRWTVDRFPSALVWEDEPRFRAGAEAGIREAAQAAGIVLPVALGRAPTA